MSGDLQTFVFDDEQPHPIRVVLRDGAPWFVAKDACAVLGIANSRDATDALDDDEKAGVGLTDISSSGVAQGREFTLVTEGGLYTLILRSRQATTPGSMAHRFRRWVTGELLPQIRKTGSYAVQPEVGDDLYLTNTKLRMVEAAQKLGGKAAARQLWADLGLPPLTEEPAFGSGSAGATAVGIDFVRQFLNARAEQTPGGRVQASELYQAYCRWAAAEGHPTITLTAMALCLTKLGLRKVNASGRRFYLGIRIKHISEFASQLGD